MWFFGNQLPTDEEEWSDDEVVIQIQPETDPLLVRTGEGWDDWVVE